MSDRTLRLALAVVALVGTGLATYLTYVHFDEGALICTTGGCEQVQQSEYAELAGIPVALLGLIAYVVVLALVAWDTPLARTLTAALALGALAFSCYLVALQLFVIEATCVWCMVNDLLVVPLLAVLSVLRLRSAPATA
ncbi:MAG TPA: vitamin K epoxide reductase family protein [Gaiellaceae bacterium]